MQKLNTYVFYLLIICTHTQTHERFSIILYMYEFREYRVYREYKITVYILGSIPLYEITKVIFSVSLTVKK